MSSRGEHAGTILVIEDDESIREAVVYNLGKEGYRMLAAADGLQGLRLLRRERPDLMVLDLMLPGMDGWKLCEQVREEGYDLPIIVMSARTSDFDKVQLLDLGADDYLTKPVSMSELAARVRANLRRSRTAAGARGAAELVEAGPLVIDPGAHKASVDGRPLELTPRELAVLHYMVRQAPKTVSREEIYQAVWGYEMLHGDRSVDVFVRRLRKKLEEAAPGRTFLQTHYGFGYRFEVLED
ncbi:MAG: DNA-binding response regulator [Gaiellales bacterium]|nr:MAG: DNA-binding response regulator [Gaiellales bacterium]